MTTTRTPLSVSTTDARAGTSAVFVVLLVALVARIVFAAWERYDGPPSYDEVAAFADAYWPMNVLVFGPAFSLGFAAQAVLAWRLGRGRARVISGVAAGLLATGGAVFALAATAHALPYDWAVNHGILDEGTGRSVLAAFSTAGSPELVPYIVVSQAAIALGAMAAAIGGRMSRTMPTWMLAVTVALVLVFFLLPDLGLVVTMVLALVQAAVWALLGWFGWRVTR
jgi:hypothetical protein